MKKIFYVIFVTAFLNAAAQDKVSNGTKNNNPIVKGWYADPEAVIFDKMYWIYPTFSARYEKQVYLDAFSSKNLTNWVKHEKVLDTASVKWAKKALWAPSIIKHNDRYFLFFGANDIQSDYEIGGIGVASSAKPEGPFVDYLGKPLVDKFYNGAHPIDQFVFKDQDGQYYLIYGGWKHCNIAKLKPDFTGFITFDGQTVFKEITPQHYVEGPFMFIRNNKYYFMWSEGGWTGPDYSVAYAIADSPMGPFKRIGKILEQNTKIAVGAGHHSVIKLPDSDKYFIVYHRRPITENHADSREICIEEMYFDETGYIKPVTITNEGVKEHIIK